MKKQKEITHMGNDNRCETCFNDGKLAERKRILEIIDSFDYIKCRGNIENLKQAITQEKK